MHFIDLVKQHTKAQKISQRHLAKLMGISQTSMSKKMNKTEKVNGIHFKVIYNTLSLTDTEKTELIEAYLGIKLPNVVERTINKPLTFTITINP